MSEWSGVDGVDGYPLDCYDYQSTCGAKNEEKVSMPLFLQSPIFDLQDAEFSDSYSDSAPSQEVSFREDDNENDDCTEKCQSKRG